MKLSKKSRIILQEMWRFLNVLSTLSFPSLFKHQPQIKKTYVYLFWIFLDQVLKGTLCETEHFKIILLSPSIY